MPEVLWIPIGAIVVGVLFGAMIGSRSRSTNAGKGALIGLYLSLMISFPLLALGLSTT